ncbi:MAG: glutamine--fructose-6-phosphate transaminase (isomerizing) [bacterium]
MCGIIGYVGKQNALPIILSGLKRLEYRGYDSAGIALLSNKQIILKRSKGKINELALLLANQDISGTLGIGHTRWATHGKPCEENAHPHTDCNQDIVIVHNGIVENYLTLKAELVSEGHLFKSETDTEVIVHLIENFYKDDIFKAVNEAIKRIEGTYALGVICSKEPERIIAARNGSPLIIGIGEGENFIASDIPAILSYTRQVVFLEDGHIASLSPTENFIYSLKANKKVDILPTTISWDPVMAEKEGYKHFMLKEIYEQPRAVSDTVRGRIREEEGDVCFECLNLTKEEIANFNRVYIVACGTAWHAGLVGKFLLEDKFQIPIEVDIASEFRYRKLRIDSQVLFIAISQSGETADTLAALRIAKQKGAKVISICNVLGSSVSRESDGVIFTHAGPEIGVASTKAFTCQLTALYLLMIHIGRIKDTIPKDEARKLIHELLITPQLIEQTLKLDNDIANLARIYMNKSDFLYLGRGINYPIALEGALKLKEISYIHAEGYPAGEMKHGPIALIDSNLPVVVLAPKNHVYEKTIANIEGVKARDGIVIVFASDGDRNFYKKADHVFYLPKTSDYLTPLLFVIPLQLLAYHIAEKRGCDVDQPRNLAKSVTVE